MIMRGSGATGAAGFVGAAACICTTLSVAAVAAGGCAAGGAKLATGALGVITRGGTAIAGGALGADETGADGVAAGGVAEILGGITTAVGGRCVAATDAGVTNLGAAA
jgi:hypothetical protein